MAGTKKRLRFSDEMSSEQRRAEEEEKRLEEKSCSDPYEWIRKYEAEVRTGQMSRRAARAVRELQKEEEEHRLFLERKRKKPTHTDSEDDESQFETSEESIEETEPDTRTPIIELGEYGHTPRWIVVPASPQHQLKPHDGIPVQPPTGSLSARNSPSPSSPKMATLVWEFQPGHKDRWAGLTEEELHEYAYKFLERAMRDPTFRDQFRRHILDCSFAHLVADVEDCLPPLPESSATDLLGKLEFSGPFLIRKFGGGFSLGRGTALVDKEVLI